MITSLLDTDLYKFTMSSCYFLLYRSAEGTFRFDDRDREEYDERFISLLKERLCELEKLRLTKEEKAFLATIRFLPTNYIEWLETFRFDTNRIKIRLDGERHLQIEVTDLMYKATLYEVPLLAVVSSCIHHWRGDRLDEKAMMSRLDKKIDFALENRLMFSEFGTRRRFSFAVHNAVCSRLRERASEVCVGTSNVFLAWKNGMKPSGTMAHEWIQFHQGIYGFKSANLLALDAWSNVFGGDLGTALIDTFTTASFLHTLTMKQAKLFDGMRQDSGNEFEIGDMIIEKYKACGIDPLTKTIVFSNALDFEKYKLIADYFRGRIKVSAGIGTNLTCDTRPEGIKPANIVMKLSRCRYSAHDFWEDVIKISDDAGKHLGKGKLFRQAVDDLHLRELGVKIDEAD
ncbi:MAG: nicotinate phosphoribosyltransferase [Prevotella sp.]|nr:nicotinate phosphoribosyltransferase [Prevotella sp.]